MKMFAFTFVGPCLWTTQPSRPVKSGWCQLNWKVEKDTKRARERKADVGSSLSGIENRTPCFSESEDHDLEPLMNSHSMGTYLGTFMTTASAWSMYCGWMVTHRKIGSHPAPSTQKCVILFGKVLCFSSWNEGEDTEMKPSWIIHLSDNITRDLQRRDTGKDRVQASWSEWFDPQGM